MRERLGSGPRIVRALFAAVLVLGFPIAIALPGDLNGKVYASGAVVVIDALPPDRGHRSGQPGGFAVLQSQALLQ